MPNTAQDRVLSVKDVAEMCKVSNETIRRWIRRHGLKAYNTTGGLAIKILESDLRAFAEEPIRFENKALGYEVTFELKEFFMRLGDRDKRSVEKAKYQKNITYQLFLLLYLKGTNYYRCSNTVYLLIQNTK